MEQHNDKTSISFASAGPRWVDWLMEHRTTAAIGTIVIVLVVAGGLWFMQSRRVKEVKEYETADLLAQELNEELEKAPNQAEEASQADGSQTLALYQLKDLVDRHKTLQMRFDSLLAQEMLLLNKQKEIDPYAQRAINRMKALGLSDFASYSEVSRLAGLGKYKEALKKALDLKAALGLDLGSNKNMESSKDMESNKDMALNKNKPAENATSNKNVYLLQGFLLLKIATLNQLLGNHPEMMQTLLQLKEHLGLSSREVPLTSQEKELASLMLNDLHERENFLIDYMEETPQAASL